jgi:hypothetical protein
MCPSSGQEYGITAAIFSMYLTWIRKRQSYLAMPPPPPATVFRLYLCGVRCVEGPVLPLASLTPALAVHIDRSSCCSMLPSFHPQSWTRGLLYYLDSLCFDIHFGLALSATTNIFVSRIRLDKGTFPYEDIHSSRIDFCCGVVSRTSPVCERHY